MRITDELPPNDLLLLFPAVDGPLLLGALLLLCGAIMWRWQSMQTD